MLIVLNPIQCRPLLAANLASIILSSDWLTANILKYAKCADKMALFILFSYFFLLTRYQSKISGIGVTPPTSSTVQWHTSITAPPLFEVYNGVECWLHHYLLFFVWPCSLARSCRRCCCRSAAREGELQGRRPSRHAAFQGLWPVLCCVPRNERLAGYLMWCY